MPFEELYTQTASGFPDWRDVEFQAVELKLRSVLFFPRGTWHRTFASADSLAVAIVVEPPPAIDCFLEELRLVLLQDPRWRKLLYRRLGQWQATPTGLGAGRKTTKRYPAGEHRDIAAAYDPAYRQRRAQA